MSDRTLDLGNFSVSLAVKDLKASQAFYEKLGLTQVGGDPSQGWVILQNPTATIGLFQGMFPKNVLTWNPGWDRSCQTSEGFTDVRELQAELEARGLTLTTRAEDGSGPANLTLEDPDGNPILLDQHVPKA